MRGVWAGSLGLSLSLLVGDGLAQEAPGRPGIALPSAAGPTVGRSPAAVLGRPVPLANSDTRTEAANPGLERQVLPVSFNNLAALGGARPVVRAQIPDFPLPLPPGPTALAEPSRIQAEPGPGGTGKTSPDAPTLTMPRKVEGMPPQANGNAAPAPNHTLFPFVGSAFPTEGMPFEPDCYCEMCCGRQSRLWLSGEYLLWWIKDSALPPLVTASPADTPRELAGVLGAPGTVVLFGGSSVNNEERSGGRFAVGFWLDPCQRLGLETDFFFLGQRTVRFDAGSAGLPILARPIFDVTTGRETSELVAFPGLLAGGISVSSSNRLWGLEENLRLPLLQGTGPCGTCIRVGVLGGFRYMRLDEGISIRESLSVAPDVPMLGGTGILVSDQFGTHNDFYGGQLGAMVELRRGSWYCDLLTKLALGATHQVVNINGSTTFVVPGGPTVVRPGGLLALPSNIGHYSREFFGVIPEVGIKVGYQVTPHIRAFVGYSFLYWNNVARPGNQIDRVVNVSQLPMVVGSSPAAVPPRPAFAFNGTDFWAQGVNFGLEFRY